MNKERDLLPWVLGALSATAVAIAITAVSSTKTAPPAPTPVVAAHAAPVALQGPERAPALPPADAAAAPAPQADPPPQQSPMQAQVAPEAPAPSGQIWECTTKGVKTFSNNPCGDKSTPVEVGPINTMNPTPVVHYARGYAPAPAPAYADSDNSSDREPYSDQAGAESSGNSYTIVQGGGFVARRRPEHHPHHRPMPNHHNSGPMPRKY